MLVLFLSAISLLVAGSSAATTSPTADIVPLPAACQDCGDYERCEELSGQDARCVCISGYRRDAQNVCQLSDDHIDMALVPDAVEGRVEGLVIALTVTTLGPRDLRCELLSNAATKFYKFGGATLHISTLVTAKLETLEVDVENELDVSPVHLSCWLSPTGLGYANRTTLEVKRLAVVGPSIITDFVNTTMLPRFLDAMAKGSSLEVTVGASARGPRDLHIDLLLLGDSESVVASDVIHGDTSHNEVEYVANLTLNTDLKLGDALLWRSYLTPVGLSSESVVPGGWGEQLALTIGATHSPSSTGPSPTPSGGSGGSGGGSSTGGGAGGNGTTTSPPTQMSPIHDGNKPSVHGDRLLPLWIILALLLVLALFMGVVYWRRSRSRMFHSLTDDDIMEYTPPVINA